MSDQNQILRLLGTIREESAAIRSRQEELFELLISYKDQIEDLKKTVIDKLSGLPKSPYIAGQLVPAPDTIDGTEDFRQLLATYLHGAPPDDEDNGPVDVEMPPPAEVDPDSIKLESEGRARGVGGGGSGGGGGGRRGRRSSGGPRDSDLERGPDRDVEPFDLKEPEKKSTKKKSKRRRRRKKTATKGGDE